MFANMEHLQTYSSASLLFKKPCVNILWCQYYRLLDYPWPVGSN